MISSLATDANRDAIFPELLGGKSDSAGYSEFDEPISVRVQHYLLF